MKTGIEARDLQEVRQACSEGAYWQQVVRLVQRRKRHKALQPGKDCGRYAHRRGVVGATVDDAMTDRDKAPAAGVRTQPIEQKRNRAFMARRAAIRPRMLVHDGTGRVLRAKARVALKLFEVAGNKWCEVDAGDENGKLEARRAGVQNQDRIAH
jgi:hypothetical protein